MKGKRIRKLSEIKDANDLSVYVEFENLYSDEKLWLIKRDGNYDILIERDQIFYGDPWIFVESLKDFKEAKKFFVDEIKSYLGENHQQRIIDDFLMGVI